MDCFHCFDCCKSSTDKTSEVRRKEEETSGCFCCKRSSKEGRKGRTRGVCGVGCFFICESTAKDYSSGAKSCCCFPCNNNKSSDKNEEARVMKKNKKKKKKKGCFHCFRLCDSNSSNKEKKGTCSCYDGSSWCCFSCCNRESAKVSSEEKVKSSEKKPEKQLKEKKKRGKKVMCCCGSCCSKSLDERRPESKRSCESILSCLCCIYTKKTDSSMKKKKRKKSICLRWRTKQKEEKGNQLATLVRSMSFKSDSGGKNRFDAKEILRLGNINIASRVFTYKELMAATNNFKDDCLLGSGGFGRVYKGQLAGTDEVIAVKKLDRSGYQGSREFLIEVLMLGLLQHPNLVKLLGYCAERDQRILVYEYMPLGSLHDHLLDILPKNKPLDWFTRMKIAAGAAKGLEHLHDAANPPVIYRDMKASNILLDENYNPKLSDFGLAKLGPTGDKTHVSTRVMGTYGYCAPEYALTGQLTKMSDVYSFGVLFLELITGRKAIDITRPKAEQHLAHWAETLFKEKRKLVGMADPILRGKFPKKGLCQALAVADMCIQNEASTRPLISDVVSAIEYLENPSPTSPAINGRIMPLKFASSEQERRTSEKSSFDEENNGREIIADTSVDEEKHTRMRTADLSFDEETFQSLSSETGSLREEEI